MSYDIKTKNDGRTKKMERLRVAREKRLRENPPKYANVHPSVLEKGDDHPFSRRELMTTLLVVRECSSMETIKTLRMVKNPF